MRDEIIDGCAEILWALAWADHAEETDCTNMSGTDICEIMPQVGDAATEHATRIVDMFENAAGMDIYSLFDLAMQADGSSGEIDPFGKNSNRFGGCLAYMALGHGVSWFDDHEECKVLESANAKVNTDADLSDEVTAACDAH